MTDIGWLRWATPRVMTFVVLLLTLIIVADVLYAATHKRETPQGAVIEPCALVLTRESGPECR